MNKKIYISLPIKISEKTVSQRYKNAVDSIKSNKKLANYDIVGPINIEFFDKNGLIGERTNDYAWYMGEDIKILIRCDAILMCDGWEESEGCTAEYEVAKVYKKEIYSLNSIL